MPKATVATSGLFVGFHEMAAVDTAAAAANLVANLTAIGDLSIERNIADFNTHHSEWTEKIGTTLSVSDLDIEGVLIGDNAHQEALLTSLTTGTKKFYAITYGADADLDTGDIARFQAFVSSFTKMGQIDDKVSFKATLAITGKVTTAAL